MGCTSSAPSVAAPDVHATREQSVKFAHNVSEQNMKGQEKVAMEEEKQNEDPINVLPKCDTLAESIQVDSNNKSSTDLHSLENERVSPEKTNIAENDVKNGNSVTDTSQNNKTYSLEKIVDRVIETNIMDNIMSDLQDTPKEDQENHNIKEQTITLALNNAPLNENDEDMEKEENGEEPASPDQSISSRVTRWEALADIAAELPPSLTVDPITGQIYALSK